MFFATLWALLTGKKAIENGIKDAELNKWSKQNTYNPTTNTYIDAKGFNRDASSGAIRNIYRTKDGRLIGKDIFGNDIIDYTSEQQQRKIIEARANQDEFHTVVMIMHGGHDRFLDLKDSSKIYVIEYLTSYYIKAEDIPVYVDVETGEMIKPIDEYMEFISHDEYYDAMKEQKDSLKFYIRDMTLINELIKQFNSVQKNKDDRYYIEDERKINDVIHKIEHEAERIKKTIEKDKNDKKEKSIKNRYESSGKAWFI